MTTVNVQETYLVKNKNKLSKSGNLFLIIDGPFVEEEILNNLRPEFTIIQVENNKKGWYDFIEYFNEKI